uniref:Late endosomal/lysosomal adaptor and MAPK and MTOR activator 4 n=1 Tax=Albugo laibachii Nc14 TaxID=890382 RepID=F0W9H1_9STRA|nr:AlNc14C40G3430 [Albugo laibachii Nc14]|eukprot:CCA17785.1 AlNc14C40G3430 [Albugo laibachii Nc14]
MEDLQFVPNQIGSLILSRANGCILSASGTLDNTTGKRVASVLYSMLQDAANVLEHSDEVFKRFTVTHPTNKYIVTSDTNRVYIVHKNV